MATMVMVMENVRQMQVMMMMMTRRRRVMMVGVQRLGGRGQRGEADSGDSGGGKRDQAFLHWISSSCGALAQARPLT